MGIIDKKLAEDPLFFIKMMELMWSALAKEGEK